MFLSLIPLFIASTYQIVNLELTRLESNSNSPVTCVGDLPVFKNNIISMVKPCTYNSVYYTVKSYLDDKEFDLNIGISF